MVVPKNRCNQFSPLTTVSSQVANRHLVSRIVTMDPWLRLFLRSANTILASHFRTWRVSRANYFSEEKDLVIIGGGVAGYVAAIKAGQEGMKVRSSMLNLLIAIL